MRPLAILAAAALRGLIAASLSTTTLLPAARADPPPLGQAVSFLEPMVVCKTYPELKELVEALRISVETYDAKLRRLGVDRSECDVNTVNDVLVAGCEEIGVIKFKDAQRRLWMVHFTNAAKDGWGLYEEIAVTAPAVAI
jgi:hypothetical protein